MRKNYTVNSDGLMVGYGPADTRNELAGGIETKGRVRQVSMTVYYDKDVTAEDMRGATIPAGATILSADAVVVEAFTGGTSIEVGTIGTDGSSADANALITATEGATANLTANAVVTGAGALVGAVTTADVNLTSATTGSYTAGKAVVTIEYVMPAA